MSTHKILTLTIVFSLFALAFGHNADAQTFRERFGPVSETFDDAVSGVGPYSGFTITDCHAIQNDWDDETDGSFYGRLDRSCWAQNAIGANGVYPDSLQYELPPYWDAYSVVGAFSGRRDNDVSIASCDEGDVLTGCQCQSDWKSCDGAIPINSLTCIAHNEYAGDGVHAIARCISPTIDIAGHAIAEGSYSTWSRAFCPDGYAATGCTCHDDWNNCEWPGNPAGNPPSYCWTATTDPVTAYAICIDWSEDECAGYCGIYGGARSCHCDPECEDYMDCCPDYYSSCL